MANKYEAALSTACGYKKKPSIRNKYTNVLSGSCLSRTLHSTPTKEKKQFKHGERIDNKKEESSHYRKPPKRSILVLILDCQIILVKLAKNQHWYKYITT